MRKRLANLADGEHSDFRMIGPDGGRPKLELPTKESEVNAFIRERTRLFFGSSIIPVLDEMIERGVKK